jgi:hypothetical protein
MVTAPYYVLHRLYQVFILNDVRDEDKKLTLTYNTFNIEVEGLHYIVIGSFFAG